MGNTSVLPKRFWETLADDERIIEAFRANPLVRNRSATHYLLTDRRLMYDTAESGSQNIKSINLNTITSMECNQIEKEANLPGMGVEYDTQQIRLFGSDFEDEITVFFDSVSAPLVDALQKQIEAAASSDFQSGYRSQPKSKFDPAIFDPANLDLNHIEWRRAKQVAVIPAVGFGILLVMFSIRSAFIGPLPDDATLSAAPILTFFTALFMLSVFSAGLAFAVLASRGKRLLYQKTGLAYKRHPITLCVFLFFTYGAYAYVYILVRWNK